MITILIKTVSVYFILIISMRLMGKRQLGELQPAELVVTLVISDLAAVPMQENGLPLMNGVLPILVLVSLELLISGAMLKCPAIARLISGSPLPIIQDGKVSEKVMRKMRITVDDLLESLRQQNIFDIRQVQYAIVETNGHISAYCYPRFQPATAGMVTDRPDDEMPIVVVSDGQMCDWGMRLCGLSEEALEGILRKKKCSLQDAFLLTVTVGGTPYLLTRKDVKGGGG